MQGLLLQSDSGNVTSQLVRFYFEGMDYRPIKAINFINEYTV